MLQSKSIDYPFILLRLGELTLKGRNRYQFEQRIASHIQYVMKPFPRVSMTPAYGRLYIELNGEPYAEVAAALKKVPGIASFSPVKKAELQLQSIRGTALELMQQLSMRPRTFKVVARRAYKKFNYDSQQMNHLVGGYILEHMEQLQVDVHQPQVVLSVEIREEGAYVYCEVVPGMGGYPLGSSGKAMLMLSGGIDSPVAGWLSIRRGLILEAVHFHSFPYTSERAQHKVKDLTRKLTQYSKPMRLHMVPFTAIQTRLSQQCRENLWITLMRRAMMRITAKLAVQQGASAIITGESLGQVASQTLPSLSVIGKVTDLPLLRPLIMMDKSEIIEIAHQIDTYDISILPYDDCCTLFLPKSPSTNPNANLVERTEQGFTWLDGLIDEAVAHTEVITLGHGADQPLANLF